jgi:hypothetical protein
MSPDGKDLSMYALEDYIAVRHVMIKLSPGRAGASRTRDTVRPVRMARPG